MNGGVQKAKLPQRIHEDFYDDKAVEKRRKNLEEAIKTYEAAAENASQQGGQSNSLRIFEMALRARVKAEERAGLVPKDEREILVEEAEKYLKNPELRWERTKHHKLGTIFQMPPQNERLPNLSGSTVRVLGFEHRGGLTDFPIPYSYYWCAYVLKNENPRWVQVPLSDYLNPANWRAPPTNPADSPY